MLWSDGFLHGLDIGAEILPHRRHDHLQAEIVRGFVPGWMGRDRGDHFRIPDFRPIGFRPLPGRLDSHQDTFRSARSHGTDRFRVPAEQGAHHGDEFRLHFQEAGKAKGLNAFSNI